MVSCFETLAKQLENYLTKRQITAVESAYVCAKQAHGSQKRASGEPYITHPVAVAGILANQRLDCESIMAAILHDVLEDTAMEKAQLANQFGDKVAELVDGVSKLKLIRFETKVEQQAESLRKMMLAMAKDIRVVLIKLADRLHNMQTLGALSREKQRRIARETLEIYAPIANRLGMYTFQVEFEDLGFSYLYPQRYRVLKEAVQKARGNRREIMKKIVERFQEDFKAEKIKIEALFGREKHLYSLYNKMRKKDLSLSEVMDVYAIRIIVHKIDTCYRCLGVVHNAFKPVHSRFKDYIALPKSNGYQSLHTTVLGMHGLPIEVQIRTIEMDKMAESGISAHWLYKTRGKSKKEVAFDSQLRATEWLKGILENQQDTGSPTEFIENVKMDLYPDEVYVFTPTGEIFPLPSGATCVDFAYSVHTDVGDSCIAAKIDRRLVPLSTRLLSGQTVEVITAEGAHPNPAWLSFIATPKARSNIRNWLKRRKSNESRVLGKRLLERALASVSLTFSNISKQRLESVLSELKLKTLEDLFQEIGLGNQMPSLIARRLAVTLSDKEKKALSRMPLAIQGTEGMVVSFAQCCRPIPGDEILGFLSAGRGIMVHRENCNNLMNIKKNPEKMIHVDWADQTQNTFQVEVMLEVMNHRGMLAKLANVISECGSNIIHLQVDETDAKHNFLTFLFTVKNKEHFSEVLRHLRELENVLKASRVK